MKPEASCSSRLRLYTLWIVVGCMCLMSVHEASAASAVFKLQSARGKVYLRPAGARQWTTIRRGTKKAAPGDRVRTGPNSSVSIVSGSRRVAVGENTEVILRGATKRGIWNLIVGKLKVLLNGRKRLEIRAPAAIAAAEGTIFQLEVAEDGTTVLTVAEGDVRFYNDLGRVTVAQAQQSTAKVGQAPTRPIAVDPTSLMAWEADLQTLIIEPEYPHVSTDPEQLQQALEAAEQAVEAAPEDGAAHARLARVLIDMGRLEQAIEHATRATEIAPDNASYRGVLGFALLAAGQPAEAGEQFDLALQAEAQNPQWHLGKALIALGQRDPTPAIDMLQDVARMAPQDPTAKAYLAAANLRAGDLQRAVDAAQQAVQLAPQDYIANTYLSYVRLAEGKVDEAVSAASTAAEVAPGSALAHDALGTALFFDGRFARARQQLQQAIELNDLSASAHLTLAKVLAAQDDLDGALDLAAHATSLDPNSAPARSTLGLLYLLNNDPQRAGLQFEKALVMNPDLAEARTGWGMVLRRKGRFNEALNQQKAAVSLDTDSASAHNNLGSVYAADGKMDLAIREFERAIELQPNWGMPYANLAMVHLEQNRYAEALQAARKAVELGARSPFTHTILARIFLSQGRVDRAMSELRQALALDEDYPHAHFQLSRLYLKQDRARDAIREILTATTKDPSAMIETRRYARTENTLSGGSDDAIYYDLRHSDIANDGRLNYFVSGSISSDQGFRPVNQDADEAFAETIVGYQSDPREQLVLTGNVYDTRDGLPGPVTAQSAGDPDDSQDFSGSELHLAYRRQLTDDMTATAKYSVRDSRLKVTNPSALNQAATNPYRRLDNETREHSSELRVDMRVSGNTSLQFGYSHVSEDRNRRGTAAVPDPQTGRLSLQPFSTSTKPDTDTAWLELHRNMSDRLTVAAGGYWGRETGAENVALPKAAVVYRSSKASWLSFTLVPIFRADALDLAPVEPLADPRGLRYLNFTEGGSGRSYELRYQRQTGSSTNLTASLTHQRVRGLLVDVEDPRLTALPERTLIDKGERWVGDLAYEQQMSDELTGRLWGRWQTTEGSSTSRAITGADWPYAPEWQFGGRLDYINEGGLRMGLDAAWTDDRFADLANTQTVDSYPLVNLRIDYQRNLQENYFLDITNLFDRDYQTFSGFPGRDMSIRVGVESRFD